MVLKYEDIIPGNPEPGITRRILARGGSLMGVEASFIKGAVGSVHKHPHEQVSYIVSGSFQYEADGVKYILKAGDSYYVEPESLHGATALEDSIILDIFTPQREDFIGDV
ncbi:MULTISPECIES: cupin domain-containing protein [Lacrimispora]|uniref:Cupin n=1 Tax=Lacrimispora celerecrescens TaxID=29354 RepID=A0A084JHY2_9FIRM|nr:cupin domain-containing protein [Lacrimispora celerecrescens]KEZ88566.1 cupin [Lacrimispora celerecrescens]HBG12489.1 cupin domain-containing protein [Clostridium sp.]